MCLCERVFHLSSREIRAAEGVATHGVVCPTLHQPLMFLVSLWAFLFSVAPTLSFQGQSQENRDDTNRAKSSNKWRTDDIWTLAGAASSGLADMKGSGGLQAGPVSSSLKALGSVNRLL